MTDTRFERWVGAFVLLGAAAVASLLVAAGLGEEWLSDSRHYRLVLDNGYGIAPGIDVTIAGMTVGHVESVELTPDRRVEVRLHVDDAHASAIRVDARGDALFTLTGKVVEIRGGSLGSEALADGGKLQPGSNFDPLVSLQGESLLARFDRLESVLTDIEKITAQINLGDARIPEIIDRLMQLLDDITAGRGTVGQLLIDETLLDDSRRVLAQVDGLTAELHQLVAQLDATSRDISATSAGVARQSKTLESTVASVERGTAAVEHSTAAVEAAVDDLPPTMQSLQKTLIELERTMKAIQRLPLVRSRVEE